MTRPKADPEAAAARTAAARERIGVLREGGHTLASISRAAHLSDVTLWSIVTGRTRRVRAVVVERLLAVPDTVPPRTPATLAGAVPEVAATWHPRLNADTPDDVAPWSTARRAWLCAAGHTWTAPVLARTRGRGCPDCYGAGRLSPGASSSRSPGS